MKCPKCKKEMDQYTTGNMIVRTGGYYICNNKECWFFGIERKVLDEQENKENW